MVWRMSSESTPVTQSAMDKWQQEVRQQWRDHKVTHDRIETKIDSNTERVSRIEGKLENGINTVLTEVKTDVSQLAKNQWRIIWYVLGGTALLGTIVTAVAGLFL